ncbi:hypothetical protein [Mesorhizobium sp. ES1-1]|uniref:hypothetical protein n=1 Tax=Mesorhizobium sp. ES1-1 TaxID=2876629 RepID=UPI001CCCF795|nr:hypothetical protein [Mesorhizobium sp. ES1-1]MBZ9678669.1 hypothetical protein [Mesorhizobium sp. ES1-1]
MGMSIDRVPPSKNILHWSILAALSVLIALGYVDITWFKRWPPVDGGVPRVSILIWCVKLAPIFPIVASMVRLTPLRLTKTSALLFAYITFVVGLLLTLVAAGLSGAGGHVVFMHGATLTIAVLASFLVLCRGDIHSPMGLSTIALMIIPAIAATWSLAAGGMLVASARAMSSARPYCIALHGDRKPVSSLANLRGLSFYTTRTGYRDSFWWFFHGVLIVQNDVEKTVYNWSAKKLRFELLPPKNFEDDPRNECVPQHDFINTLPLI